MNLKKGALTMILALVLGMMGTGCGSEDAVERPYDYHLDEYVTVGEYTGLEYTAFHVEVTEKEVDDAIAQVLMKYVEQKEVTAGIVKAGDYVNIKYTMEVDGQLMEGTDQQSYTVKVGDSGLLPAVDQALIGAEAGQNVTVETAFPEEYDI
ncbi:MAG: FKBP-type peptidyl-prolyl cis-trans isomerase, partial [Firmicutes bacterium]|nr:FKBP-type peptidyl-prolyl cis-trans isomerase [Bacillota bacterium]